MRKLKRRNISMSDESWEHLGKVSDDLHSSRSGVLEMMVIQMKRSEELPIGKFVEEVIRDVAEVYGQGKGPGKYRERK